MCITGETFVPKRRRDLRDILDTKSVHGTRGHLVNKTVSVFESVEDVVRVQEARHGSRVGLDLSILEQPTDLGTEPGSTLRSFGAS